MIEPPTSRWLPLLVGACALPLCGCERLIENAVTPFATAFVVVASAVVLATTTVGIVGVVVALRKKSAPSTATLIVAWLSGAAVLLVVAAVSDGFSATDLASSEGAGAYLIFVTLANLLWPLAATVQAVRFGRKPARARLAAGASLVIVAAYAALLARTLASPYERYAGPIVPTAAVGFDPGSGYALLEGGALVRWSARRAYRFAGPFTAISVDDDGACAIANDGAWCFRDDFPDQPPKPLRLPIRDTPASLVVIARTGGMLDGRKFDVCVAMKSGSVGCWRLSSPDAKIDELPVDPALDHPKRLLRNGGQFCALGESGAVRCPKGYFERRFERSGPVLDAVSTNHGPCYLLEGGTVSCLGSEERDEKKVEGVAGAVELAAGQDHVCARDRSGGVRCWGDGGLGQLGVGEATRGIDEPVRVKLPAAADQLFAARDLTCARLVDKTIWCWGAAGAEVLRLDHAELRTLMPGVELAVATRPAVLKLPDHQLVVPPEAMSR